MVGLGVKIPFLGIYIPTDRIIAGFNSRNGLGVGNPE